MVGSLGPQVLGGYGRWGICSRLGDETICALKQADLTASKPSQEGSLIRER